MGGTTLQVETELTKLVLESLSLRSNCNPAQDGLRTQAGRFQWGSAWANQITKSSGKYVVNINVYHLFCHRKPQ